MLKMLAIKNKQQNTKSVSRKKWIEAKIHMEILSCAYAFDYELTFATIYFSYNNHQFIMAAHLSRTKDVLWLSHPLICFCPLALLSSNNFVLITLQAIVSIAVRSVECSTTTQIANKNNNSKDLNRKRALVVRAFYVFICLYVWEMWNERCFLITQMLLKVSLKIGHVKSSRHLHIL